MKTHRRELKHMHRSIAISNAEKKGTTVSSFEQTNSKANMSLSNQAS